MPPIRTVRGRAGAQARSHYETPFLKILVGEEEAVFNLNHGLLQATSFFVKHGRPSTQPARSRSQTVMSQIPEQPIPNDISDCTVDTNEDTDTVDLTIDDADFILKGKFYYTRDAFAIFVRSLNDAPPLQPENQKDCRALFKAYALAQEYDNEKLQNQVIDALQIFYSENTIPVDDILYLISQWGDRVDCFLAAYLIAQAAYEIALDYTKFRQDNEDVEKLFTAGSTVIVEQLFQAVVQYAKPSDKQDPAKHKRAWRFATS